MGWLAGNSGETTTADDRMAARESRETEREGGKVEEKWKRKEEEGVLKCPATVPLRSSPLGEQLFSSLAGQNC